MFQGYADKDVRWNCRVAGIMFAAFLIRRIHSCVGDDLVAAVIFGLGDDCVRNFEQLFGAIDPVAKRKLR